MDSHKKDDSPMIGFSKVLGQPWFEIQASFLCCYVDNQIPDISSRSNTKIGLALTRIVSLIAHGCCWLPAII